MSIATQMQTKPARKPLQRLATGIWLGATVFGCLALGALAADHADTPFLIRNNRPDARITDLHAFARNDNLVVAVSMDPTIPTSMTEYAFPSDLQIDINIDTDANVEADPGHPLGGTILDDDIMQDIRYRVTFGDDGKANVHTIPGNAPEPTKVFVGLRDDPFIRTPRRGRNIAAIVLEVPLDQVLGSQSTILVWATASLEAADQVELAGRAVRNQFGRIDENGNNENCLNLFQPRHHRSACGQEPDVIIYDTDFLAEFPNGRELEDDVDQLARDQPLFKNRGEKDKKNDVKFLDVFPYLAPPHSPPSS